MKQEQRGVGEEEYHDPHHHRCQGCHSSGWCLSHTWAQVWEPCHRVEAWILAVVKVGMVLETEEVVTGKMMVVVIGQVVAAL